MDLRALIFDVDGTLAETEEFHRLSFNAAFAAAGLAWDWSQALYAELLGVTGGKERIAHYIAAYGGLPALDAGAIRALHTDKTARYTSFVRDGAMVLRPGVQPLVEEAREAGLKLAIATTTSRENVDALLAATFGNDPFDVIAAGDEVAAKKPAPDVYLLALERLGLEAGACVAIEDTSNGLRSAVTAGIACVLTRSLYGGTGPFDAAVVVLDSLESTRMSDIVGWKIEAHSTVSGRAGVVLPG